MIVLYNPKSAIHHRRLPLSIMALGAVLEGREEYALVDGNLEPDPVGAILALLRRPGGRHLFGVTVMPGPQLENATADSRAVRRALPEIPIVWGGYFPSDHPDVCLTSDCVDYVVRGN